MFVIVPTLPQSKFAKIISNCGLLPPPLLTNIFSGQQNLRPSPESLINSYQVGP